MRSKPAGGVGSNQYQTKPGGMTVPRADASAFAATLEHPEDPEQVAWAFDADRRQAWAAAGCPEWADAEPWINGGFTPETKTLWWDAGFDTARIATPWHDVFGDSPTKVRAASKYASWITDPATAYEWDRHGVKPTVAKLWAQDCPDVTPEQAAQWDRCGFTGRVGRTWAKFNFSVPEANEWRACFTDLPSIAAHWRDRGYTAVEAANRKHDRGHGIGEPTADDVADVFTPGDVAWQFDPDKTIWARDGFANWRDVQPWKDVGFNSHDAKQWTKVGFDPEPAARWRAHMIWPADAREWCDAGWEDPAVAAEWKDARLTGMTPAETRKWMLAGHAIGDIRVWQAQSIAFDEASLWKSAGFGAVTAVQWISGFTPSEASRWKAGGHDATSAFLSRSAGGEPPDPDSTP